MLSSTCYQDCTFSSKQENTPWWIIFLIRLTKINLAKKSIAKMSPSSRDLHCESHLLSFDENEKVKRILGDKVISKSTAVAQLYTSQGCIFIWSLMILKVLTMTPKVYTLSRLFKEKIWENIYWPKIMLFVHFWGVPGLSISTPGLPL